MQALICRRHGPARDLEFADIRRPEPAPGEVLVEVAAVGLNFLDTLIIQGKYQVRPDLPFVPGAELCGRVAALGDGVSDFSVGDRVMGFPGHGALAAFATVAAHKLVAVPDGVDDHIGAALVGTYGTTLHALKDRAALAAGETVLVLGAAGGVGLAAVGCAKAMSARVIAAASSPEKLALAKAHGADEGIDYSVEDLRARLRDLVGREGVDVVYDPVGGDFAEPAFRSLGWGGRYLVIGFAAGGIPRIPLNLPLVKGSAIVGVYWGAFVDRDPEANRANMADLGRMLAAGEVRPHVGRVRPFQEAREAIEDLAARKAMGKIVVAVNPAR